MITGYQTDSNGIYLHPVSDHTSMPFGAITDAPPQEKEEGKVIKWQTTLHVNDLTYGSPGTGSWEVLEDHRKDTLLTIPSGNPYVFDGGEYDGLGPIPKTLTDKPRPSFGKWDTTTKDWAIDNVARLESLSAEVRADRDALIAKTDWVVVKAKESDTEVPANYVTYRQALRDVTLQSGFPETITWPKLAS